MYSSLVSVGIGRRLVLEAVARPDLVDRGRSGSWPSSQRYARPGTGLVELHQRVAALHLVAGFDHVHGRRSGRRRGHGVLHLHRLEHDQHLARLDRVAFVRRAPPARFRASAP